MVVDIKCKLSLEKDLQSATRYIDVEIDRSGLFNLLPEVVKDGCWQLNGSCHLRFVEVPEIGGRVYSSLEDICITDGLEGEK